jgi:hypothetical protein
MAAAAKKKATPAQRHRAKRDPAIFRPPPKPRGDRSDVKRLALTARGVTYLIGRNIDGGTPWSFAMDAAGSVMLPVRSPDGSLVKALENEALLQQEGVRCTIFGTIYCVDGVEHDGEGLYTLTLIDETAWRLRQFTKFVAASRATTTRFGFIQRLVDEAQRRPLARMRSFIPEVDDPQPIRGMSKKKAKSGAKRKKASKSDKGLGGSEGLTVWGQRATAKQRAVIDGCLSRCKKDGCSRRVMIADIMCITQESNAGEKASVTTGDDDTGIYQQGRNWISVAGANDPDDATHAYLVTGPTSWKKVHGGLKKAPGNLSLAIHQVQGNRDPGAYARHEAEATRTVDTWLGGDHTGGTYRKRYEFTRGERDGDSENSWDAMARLVEEVHARRWAADNVLFAASDGELLAGKASLTVHGDEPWLLKGPAWSWASQADVAVVTLEVAADEWDVRPGGVVSIGAFAGVAAGRFMVWGISGDRLDSPEATVELHRPQALLPEPAAETAQRDAATESSFASGDLYEACKKISDQDRGYPHPDVHHGPWRNVTPSKVPLDCSESTSYALHLSGMFKEPQAWVSGQFARSWGKPGKGKEFTVWANGEHVWIEGYDSSGKFSWRFDTSPHGDGPLGPHVRRRARTDQSRFTARHWEGK